MRGNDSSPPGWRGLTKCWIDFSAFFHYSLYNCWSSADIFISIILVFFLFFFFFWHILISAFIYFWFSWENIFCVFIHVSFHTLFSFLLIFFRHIFSPYCFMYSSLFFVFVLSCILLFLSFSDLLWYWFFFIFF